MATLLKHSLLIGFGLLIGLSVLEALLRLVAPSHGHYYIWPPFLRQTFLPMPEHVSGVSGRSVFQINSRGLRADELSPEHDFVVLALGGSTTECLILDDAEAWPRLVQQRLNDAQATHRVWVGNAGRSGHGTREHVYQAPQLLAAFPQTSLLVLLAGVNDLGLRLQQDTAYDPDFLRRPEAADHQIQRAFSVYPLEHANGIPFYKRFEVYARARSTKHALEARFTKWWDLQDQRGESLTRWRRNRKSTATVRGELPDLGPALAEYERNLERVIDSAAARGVGVLLLTQPTLWRRDLPADARELLWLGGVGEVRPDGTRVAVYSVEALAAAMEAYNEALLRVCRRRGTWCLDLASLVPKDTTHFYDDAHFTEPGSARVARAVAAHIAQHALGVPRGPSSLSVQ